MGPRIACQQSSRPTGRAFVARYGPERRGGCAARHPRRAEAALAHSVIIVPLGPAPGLALPDSLLLPPLMKFEPTAAPTAVLFANKSLLVSAIVAPETVALAPTLLELITLLATVITAPFAEARTPLLAVVMIELLTDALPPAAASTPLLTREIFT